MAPARQLVRNFGLVALFVAAALFGIASGVFFAFVGDLPQITALDDYSPGTITRVLDRNGIVVAEFATERRQLVTYDQIPVVLRNAVLSAEDANFFQHSGLNLRRIAVAGVRHVLGMRGAGGASTITQQLAKKLFLTDAQTPERKIKEMLLSIQIEKRYTKQEILTMYCNKMFLGHGAYGVQAASQLYFAKSVSDLNLDEAAMIAGLFQGNQRQSPYLNMPAARARRATVLDRMAAQGYITTAEADAAKKRPIVTRGQPNQPRSIAPYFAEAIRIRLEEKYGSKAVYEGGLTVKTGLDSMLQQAANKALDAGLRRLDKQRGLRKAAHNVIAEGKTVDIYKNPRWSREPAEGDIYPCVFLDLTAGVIHLICGKWAATIDRAGWEWASQRAPGLLKKGDLLDVQVKKLDAKSTTFAATLEQTPDLEGAVLALDNHTGQVLAMIGGKNFERSQFNRAMQAMRQVGSTFKAFVYTAAIDRGYTVQSILQDVPASYNPGPNQPPYEPKNFDKKFEGDVTLRRAFEDSRNVPTIALMAALEPQTVIPYARAMGITTPLGPYLPIAIGAGDSTLWEMTSAYTTFPNQGVRMTPQLLIEVTDRDGDVLEQSRPEAHDALRPDTAYIMTSLMQGVTIRGTGADANQLKWTIGGKTGTTDDATDAWFIGFDPDITIGVWVGFDQKRSIGSTQQGASAALPIWEDIMRPWIAKRRAELAEPPSFERPGNVVVVVEADGSVEYYIAGTQPGIR